jgi:hypothetical protein
MASFLPNINLPPLILAHAFGLTTLGLSFVFADSTKPSSNDRSTLGIASLGLGLAYLSTSYVPQEENQFLYASVPVRMILAAVAAAKMAIDRVQGRHSLQRELLGIALYDGLGGFLLGCWLGSFGGKVPAYQL